MQEPTKTSTQVAAVTTPPQTLSPVNPTPINPVTSPSTTVPQTSPTQPTPVSQAPPATPTPTAPPSTTTSQNPQAQSTSQGDYLLVAEDNKFYSKIYQKRLSKAGLEVIVVDDGQQAIDQVKKRKPKLILTDLVMPVKDGFQVLKEIKADPSFKDIPIIVLSNLNQEKDIAEAKKLGAIQHIVKSDVQITEIVKMVQQYFV